MLNNLRDVTTSIQFSDTNCQSFVVVCFSMCQVGMFSHSKTIQCPQLENGWSISCIHQWGHFGSFEPLPGCSDHKIGWKFIDPTHHAFWKCILLPCSRQNLLELPFQHGSTSQNVPPSTPLAPPPWLIDHHELMSTWAEWDIVLVKYRSLVWPTNQQLWHCLLTTRSKSTFWGNVGGKWPGKWPAWNHICAMVVRGCAASGWCRMYQLLVWNVDK